MYRYAFLLGVLFNLKSNIHCKTVRDAEEQGKSWEGLPPLETYKSKSRGFTESRDSNNMAIFNIHPDRMHSPHSWQDHTSNYKRHPNIASPPKLKFVPQSTISNIHPLGSSEGFLRDNAISVQLSETEFSSLSESDSIADDLIGPLIKDTCSNRTHEMKPWTFTDSQAEPSHRYYMNVYMMENQLLLWYQTLVEKFAKYAHPHLTRTLSICSHRLQLGQLWDISARAICPFTWEVSRPNYARLPVLLMVAKCSCQVSKPQRNQRAKCIEVKAKVPVLWRVKCSGGMHVYKAGFDEVPVACIPLGHHFDNGLAAAEISL